MDIANEDIIMIGKNIVKFRKIKGISQEKLAYKANMSKQTVYWLERGKTKNPQLATLQRIADALGVPITELLKK